MVSPYRAKIVLRLKQLLVNGHRGLPYPLLKSGVPLLARRNKSFGSMWHRNNVVMCVPGLYQGLHTFSGTGVLMQRNPTGSGSSGDREHREKLLPSGLITTPQNIQVFADPNLTKCVRDLACDMQKVKTTLKFNKEEVADCVYEYIRLNNSYDSLKSTAKESSKLVKELTKEVEGNAKTFKEKHKELENCLIYFTEKTVKHENQMNDIGKKQEEIMTKLEAFDANLDFVMDEVATLREYIDEEMKPELNGMAVLGKILGADDGSLQVDIKKITDDLVRIRKLLNDAAEGDANKPKSVNSDGEGPHQK